MKADKKHKQNGQKSGSAESTEETLKRLIDDAKTKNEAYKKILKSLNINKNK